VGNDDSPQEKTKEGRWNHNGLDPEENLELLNWHERQESLTEPVEEEAKEITRGDSGRGREMVRKVNHARPDGLDGTAQVVTGLDGKDSGPHHCDESYKLLVQMQNSWDVYLHRIQIIGNEPYIPKMALIATGKGI
jgi:hypothetical protein